MRGLTFVTAICLTKNRRNWLPFAIQQFQAQTHPSKELLIVSDGADVRDLIPDDDRIRLIHIDETRTIGEKRNFAVRQACGPIIAHWDDDDYSAPDRLSDQVARLTESGKAVTGYQSMRFTDGRYWWYWDGDRDHALGTSLCYTKDWWSDHQFPAQQVGEDGEFVRYAREARQVASVPTERHMVASVHWNNTSFRSWCKPNRNPEPPLDPECRQWIVDALKPGQR